MPQDIQQVALRKLRLLNQAVTVSDLQIPPGNRLEALKRPGQDSTQSASMISGAYVLSGMVEGLRISKLSIITTDTEWLQNPHPGEILLEEFLKPMAITQNALARAIGVPPRRINEIVLGKRAVSADTDLRLGRYFGLSDGFFLGLQADYDLLRRRRELGDALERIEPRAA